MTHAVEKSASNHKSMYFLPFVSALSKCKICRTLHNDTERYMKNGIQENEIELYLRDECLGALNKDMNLCKEIITNSSRQIIQAVKDQINSTEICSNLSYCPKWTKDDL